MSSATAPRSERTRAEEPLISTEVLDVGSQRAFTFAIFAIIQSYKVYDLVCLKNGLKIASALPFTSGHMAFISKYLLIEGMFFYMLPMLRIPNLTYNLLYVLGQIGFVTLLNMFLASDSSLPVSAMILAVWKKVSHRELSITGDSVVLERVVDPASHFKGAKTIKILPENTILLNPYNEQLCLDAEHMAASLQMTVRVNATTELEFLQMEYKSLDNQVSLLNYTKRELKNFPKTFGDGTISFISLPLEKTGLYSVNAAFDSKNNGMRVYKAHVVVPECPRAVIGGQGSDKCMGDAHDVSISVIGAPPLTLRYSKSVNGQSQEFSEQIKPENFKTPVGGEFKKFYQRVDVKNLTWAASHSLNIDLHSVVKKSGQHLYQIDSVVDGFGNVVNYTNFYNEKMMSKYHLSHSFTARGSPKVVMSDKINKDASTKRSLVFNVQGSDGPYTCDILYESEDKQVVETLVFQFDSYGELPVERPGTYSLVSVVSKYCPGVVEGKVIVTQPVPPSLKVSSTPILDQCVGQVGLNFDLSFSGTAPYNFKANIYRMHGGQKKHYETKKYVSQTSRHQFKYEPRHEGEYVIVFEEISNTLFQSLPLLPAEDYTFKTTMRVKPSASIGSRTSGSLCLGSDTTVRVNLRGEGPFTLKYDIVETSTNKRTPFEVDVTENFYDIVTPKFNIGGDYIVSLVSIKDTSACIVPLTDDVRISVRRDVPSVGYIYSDLVNAKEGSLVDLPVKFNGVAPYKVKYEHVVNDSILETRYETFRENVPLRVSKEGFYRLVEFSDSQCSGTIEKDIMEVKFLAKPTVRFTSTLNEAVCHGSEDSVDISVTGAAPFIVEYEIISPQGHITPKSVTLSSNTASLKLPHDKPGEYKLVITGVYDASYSKKDLKQQEPLVVSQLVRALPRAGFSEHGKIYRACLSLCDVEPIKVSFVGSGPFTMMVDIFHESTGKHDSVTLEGLTSESELTSLYEDLKLGNHIVTIGGIVDANGCFGELTDSYITIAVSDVPKITLVDPGATYCVGDHVSYQLQGVAPFTIKYNFNGISHKTSEQSSSFVRLAAEAGSIAIESVEDASCLVDVNGEPLKIHEIPSVSVSQGDHVYQDIHEGDQAEVVFTFEGVPPFSLTYVRTEDVEYRRGKKRPQIMETHTITEIWEHEYVILTSVQGTYEAIEISDAYCMARNEHFL